MIRGQVIIAAGMWVASLFLPALSFRFDGERDQVLYGYQILTSGFFHLFALEFSWLANFVFWWLAWRLWIPRRQGRSMVIGGVALALLTLQTAELFIWWRFFEYPQAYAGYYLWVASNLVLALIAFMKIVTDRRHRNGSAESRLRSS